MAKIRPYYDRKIKSYIRKLQEKEDADFQAQLEGKGVLGQLAILKQRNKMLIRLLKPRKYRRSKMFLFIDLDNAVDGFPRLYSKPESPFSLKFPFELGLLFVKDGESQVHSVFQIGS